MSFNDWVGRKIGMKKIVCPKCKGQGQFGIVQGRVVRCKECGGDCHIWIPANKDK